MPLAGSAAQIAVTHNRLFAKADAAAKKAYVTWAKAEAATKTADVAEAAAMKVMGLADTADAAARQTDIRNTRLIEEIAKACKLKLSGFLVNDALELYYDLKRGREEMGYISKGWEDPGFRLGDLITVPRCKVARFKKCLA